MIVVVLILALVLRSISLTQSFWLDEGAQAVLSAQPFLSLNFGADFQPPLFYLITHLWQKVGWGSEWALRILPVIIGVLTIAIFYRFIRNIKSHREALLASLLLTLSGFHIYYSQEYRMYGLLMLISTLSWYMLWRRGYARYALTVFLSVFTHYFAFLLLFSQVFFMAIWRRGEFKKFIRYLFLGLSPFALWLPTLYEQIQTSRMLIFAWPTWSQVSGISFFKFVPLTIAKFTVGMISPHNRYLYTIAVLAMGGFFVFAISKILFSSLRLPSHKLRKITSSTFAPYGLILSWFSVPLATSWILGPFIGANTPQRVGFIIPAFFGILAIGILRIKKNTLRYICTSILIIIITIFTSFYLFDRTHHRENWKEAVSYSDRVSGERGVVLALNTDPWAPQMWYSNKPDRLIGASGDMKFTRESVQKRLRGVVTERKQVVFYTYLFEVSDPSRITETYLLKSGYAVIEERDFRGVGIIKVFSPVEKLSDPRSDL